QLFWRRKAAPRRAPSDAADCDAWQYKTAALPARARNWDTSSHTNPQLGKEASDASQRCFRVFQVVPWSQAFPLRSRPSQASAELWSWGVQFQFSAVPG